MHKASFILRKHFYFILKPMGTAKIITLINFKMEAFMKYFFKITAFVLIIAVSLNFAGCKKKQTESTEKQDSNQGGSDIGGRSFTMYICSANAKVIENLKWYKIAEQAVKIQVDYVQGPENLADYYESVDRMAAAKDLPDTLMVTLSQADAYGSQGLFLDLVPIIKKNAPNMQKYIDADPMYRSLVTSKDGSIYGLCAETPIITEFIGYRADHFEKAGIDVNRLKTLDDFTQALRALKNYYGQENGSYHPLCGRDLVIRFAAWFDAASNISINESNGIYVNGHFHEGSIDIMCEGAYDMVLTMKMWYDEGLIDPEWVKGNSDTADWEEKVLKGNGSVFYDVYDRADWFMKNGGPRFDQDFQMAVMNFLQNKNGNTMKVTASSKYNTGFVTAINADCKEETVQTIIQFLDFFYNEEGITLSNYGMEKESFKKSNDGTNVFIVDYAVEEAKPEGVLRWSFPSDIFTVCKPVDMPAFFKWNSPLIAEAAARLMTEDSLMTSYVLKLSDPQTEELSGLVDKVYDAEMTGLTEFIIGERELNAGEWKSFLEEINSLGLSRIEEIQLEAYQNTYKQ